MKDCNGGYMHLGGMWPVRAIHGVCALSVDNIETH